MPRVELTATATADLDRLIRTHSLPADTKRRVRRSLTPLRRFPRLGPALTGRWRAFRFLLGPWRWMLIVYVFLEDDDRVVVVTIQDARSSAAATAERSSR
ncbi:MAG: type II toxin-antitoxin system RelE family toxin [Candidatus Limnocylindria bacterium]